MRIAVFHPGAMGSQLIAAVREDRSPATAERAAATRGLRQVWTRLGQ